MAKLTLKTLPLSALHISPLNMRHSRRKPDVADLLPSIREHGLRQTLLVRKEGDGFGVVAGRRRWFALKQIEKETGATPLVPCAVMPEADAASALEASVIENVARLPAAEMEQFVAFRRLHEEGREPAAIAAYFGVTELAVRRVLALAALAPALRRLYAEGGLDRETARALTLATPDQQAEWLRLWNSETERAPTGRPCRAWIAGGQAITTDKALFDLAAFSGATLADLFGDHSVFADAGAFWEAQEAAIADRVDSYYARGWRDVVKLGRGDHFHRWEHEPVKKKDGGKVFIETRHDGTVTVFEGFLSRTEHRKLRNAKADGAGKGGEERAGAAAAKPEMSGPLADYIGLHRHAAAHMLAGSALWAVRRHEPRTRRDETLASLAAAPAAQVMDARRARVAALLGGAAKLDALEEAGGGARALCALFAALLTLSDAEVSEVIALAMADSLEDGGPLVEAVLHVCNTDLAAAWAPDAAFFDLCRDRRALNAMLADVATPALARRCANDTGKAQKALIAHRIEGKGCAPRPGWRPGWMQTPPRRLLKGAASPPADSWEKVADLFAEPPAPAARADAA